MAPHINIYPIVIKKPETNKVLIHEGVNQWKDAAGRVWVNPEHKDLVHLTQPLLPNVQVQHGIDTFIDGQGRVFSEKSPWDFVKGAAYASVPSATVGVLGTLMFDHFFGDDHSDSSAVSTQVHI